MIDSAAKEPALLRSMVYELARTKLQSDAGIGDRTQRQALLGTLDKAIGGVERFHAAEQRQIPLDASIRMTGDLAAPPFVRLLVDEARPARAALDVRPISARTRHLRAAAATIGAMAAVVALGGWMWARTLPRPSLPATIVAERSMMTGQSVASLTERQLKSVARGAQTETPIPPAYGVYALLQGRFYELALLQGRAPDVRVMISAQIREPSRTFIPDGAITFMIHRRDLGTNVPDRMSVRVIAQIKQGPGPDAASPQNDQPATAWAMRSISYDFRVLPVPGQSDVLMLKSDNPDLALSPGRYGLVFRNQIYDFTVAGEISDPGQCLQSISALNGGFYVPCTLTPGLRGTITEQFARSGKIPPPDGTTTAAPLSRDDRDRAMTPFEARL